MRVLIVEDREEIRALWKRFIAPLSNDILESEDLATALDLMTRIPPPDLVLLDLNLPDSKDRKTLAAIETFRALNPQCLVIVLTGMPDETLAKLSENYGADSFAEKSEIGTQTDLWRSVKRAIDKPNGHRKEPPFEKSLSLLEKMTGLALSMGKTLVV